MSLRDDSLPISSSEVHRKTMRLRSGSPRSLQRFQREERLHDARFHVEGSWAVGFAGGDAKRHFRERAGGIDGVVVAENKKLSCGARFPRPPGDAQDGRRDVFARCARRGRRACAIPRRSTRQQRSAAAFSRLGDSARTKSRSVESISGRRGVKIWSKSSGGSGLGHGPHMLAAQGTHAATTRSDTIAYAGRRRITGLICATTRCAMNIADARGSHIIISLPGNDGAPQGGCVRCDGERR